MIPLSFEKTDIYIEKSKATFELMNIATRQLN
jgi:hypothetical protein